MKPRKPYELEDGEEVVRPLNTDEIELLDTLGYRRQAINQVCEIAIAKYTNMLAELAEDDRAMWRRFLPGIDDAFAGKFAVKYIDGRVQIVKGA